MFERCKKLFNKKYIVSLLLSIFAFQLISVIVVPRFAETQRSIYIEATGKQNINSKSNGVQIKDVILEGGKHISPVEFFELSSWIHEDNGALTWNMWGNRNSIVSANKQFSRLKIALTKEEYSGIAKVYVDNVLVEEVDLYSKHNETVFVEVDGISKDKVTVYILKSLLLFTLLFLMSYIACHFFQRRMELSHNQIIVVLSTALAVSLVYVVCFSKDMRIINVLLRCIAIFGLLSIIGCKFIDFDVFNKMDNIVYKKILFILGILFCVLVPTINIINEDRMIKEKIENPTENVQEISLVSGTMLKQNINVLGKSNKAYIHIKNRDNYTGSFIVRVEQSKKEIEWNIQGLDCNNRDYIPLDLSDLSEGEFSLYITAQEGEEGKSVEILTSDQVSFGTMEKDGVLLSNTNMLMSVELSKGRAYYRQQIILFILLALVLTAVIVSVCRKKYSDKITFILVAITIFLMCCIKFPVYFLDAQPIFETGSNFFFRTYEMGFGKSFFEADFIYWPLFTRLVSDIVVLLLRQRKYAMLLLNVMGVMIVALNCALINLKVFCINIGKYERLVLSLILGISPFFCIKPLISFHNSGYWNFVIMTLLLTVEWNKLKRYQFVLALFSTIMILSKIVFVVILPVNIVALGFLIIKKKIKVQKRLTAYLILGICMAITSVGYTYNLLSQWGFFEVEKIAFGERLLSAIRQTPLYYYRTLYEPLRYVVQQKVVNSYVFVSTLVLITVVIFIWICTNGLIKYSKNKDIEDAREELVMVLYLVLSVLTAGFLVYTDKEMALSIDNLFAMNFTFDHRNFIITVEAIIFVAMFLRYICRNENIRVVAIMFFGCYLFLLPFTVETNSSLLTNWSSYYTEIYRSNYAIPIMAGDMFVEKDAFAGYIGGDESRHTFDYNFIYSAKTIKRIDSDKIIYKVDLTDTDKLKNRGVLEIYARKNAILQSSSSYVLAKDVSGKLMCKVDSIYSEDRQTIGYILPDGMKNIGALEFYYTLDNAPYPLLPEIYLGIEGEYEE